MSIDAVEVARIAHLARLKVDDGDVPRMASELSKILDFVAQMEQVDTEGVEPMAHPTDAVQRLREDAVTERDDRARFQRGLRLSQ